MNTEFPIALFMTLWKEKKFNEAWQKKRLVFTSDILNQDVASPYADRPQFGLGEGD